MSRTTDLSPMRAVLLLAVGLTACGDRDPGPEGETTDAISITPDSTPLFSDSAAPVEPWSCEDPVEVLQRDGKTPSGFVRCADGVRHRVEAVTCVEPMREGSEACSDPDTSGQCTTDADCTERPFGQCVHDGESYCGCVYGCETDADCSGARICACSGAVRYSQCLPANCTTTDDCGDHACSWDRPICPTALQPGGVVCRTDEDTCFMDSECTEEEGQSSCNFVGTLGYWECEYLDYCGDGRPFLVAGAPRVAPCVTRLDWGADVRPQVAHLSAETRAVLAAAWAQAGQDEHASVAAFARFTLQLLALGAPPELLEAAQQAARDEIEHARLCFALASAYAGRPLGPGPLDVRGALEEDADIVGMVITEACIGETLAACAAAAARDAAADPAVAAVLSTIAADELQHAALGWRFLGWWMTQTDGAGRGAVRAHLVRALRARPASAARPGLSEHGRLDAATTEAVYAAAMAEVLRPTAEALLSKHRRQHHAVTPTAC